MMTEIVLKEFLKAGVTPDDAENTEFLKGNILSKAFLVVINFSMKKISIERNKTKITFCPFQQLTTTLAGSIH